MEELKTISLIHVDDDLIEREQFSALLANFKDVKQVGSFSNVEDALAYLKSHETDIAVLDIEMKGKNGLWLANKMKDFATRIIFLTSHADYALQAFEACALHYILKPVTKKALDAALQRYHSYSIGFSDFTANTATNESARLLELMENYLDKKSFPKRIFVSNVHRITVLDLEKVIYISAEGTYSEFHTIDDAKYIASKNLKLYAGVLQNHPDFVRIHRSYIINKNHLKAIRRKRSAIFAVMQNDVELELSNLRREQIYEELLK